MESPVLNLTFPLGIPQFIQLIKAVRGYYLNKRNLDVLMESPNVMTYRVQLLGRFSTMTTDPENIKAMLSTQFKEYGHDKRHAYFLPLFGDGIFTLDGKGWQHSRTMLRPQFTREQISHVHIIENHVQKIIRMYKENEKSYSAGLISPHIQGIDGPNDKVNRIGPYVDMMPLFFKLTLDTATEFLFGESVDLLSGGNPKVSKSITFGEAFNAAQEVLTRRTVAQQFYWMIDSKEFREWCRTCKDFAMSYVQLALQRTSKHDQSEKDSKVNSTYVFLDELAKETRDPVVLRDQAINILVAGRDTTASLLSWVLLMLARNKEVFYKLRETIIKDFGDGSDTSNITFETLKRCDYLRYVLNETLRLYPTVPNNFRYALQDTSLPRGGGKNGDKPVFIPKGTNVMYSVYCTHRNPLIWGDDSNEFKPERWGQSGMSSHTWSYLPFNGGPRICLGQQFALTEVSYVVVRLLQSFKEIEADPSMLGPEPRELSTLTLSPVDGVFVKFIS